MGLRSMLGDQRGFTIIEVLVAATLLVIGVLGTMAMVDSSNAETRLSVGRDGATNLAREVVEGARSIGYDQLRSATVVTNLQALPGLSSLSGTSWTVQRRGIVYTITLGGGSGAQLCSVDDPKDGYGSHAGGGYCADSSLTGTADPQPEDFKRVTVDVSWTRNSGTRTVRQTALVDSPASKGPQVSALVATAPAVANPAAPKITTAVTSVDFKATAPAGMASVIYSVDGVDKGNAIVTGNGTDWTFKILITDLSDGDYDVGVRAADARGVVGPIFTVPMKLIRRTPAAPSGLVGGPNTINVAGVPKPVTEIEWNANSERNVIGYRVYNAASTLVCPTGVQTLSLKLSCIDQTAANGGTYTVNALYRNASDVVTEGPSSTIATDPTVNRTFYFKSTTPGSLTNCGAATPQQDMEDAFPGVDPESTFPGSSTVTRTLNFCSGPLPAGAQLRAGPATVNGDFENTGTGNMNCNVTGQVYRNGPATALNTAGTKNIPSGSTTQPFSLLMGDMSNLTLTAGDRLNMVLTWEMSVGCGSTSLHYGGTTNRSSLTVPANQIAPPNPPIGLSATTLTDGTTKLSWAAPEYGNPVSFYRIYRDGVDYTSRLDATGLATDTTYVDNPGGATHTYRVTSVSRKLAESAMAGPVAK